MILRLENSSETGCFAARPLKGEKRLGNVQSPCLHLIKCRLSVLGASVHLAYTQIECRNLCGTMTIWAQVTSRVSGLASKLKKTLKILHKPKNLVFLVTQHAMNSKDFCP